MLLEDEVVPTQLKEWLLYLNLTVPILRSHIRLNKARTVLRWPLDITACQNDKLLYIAPPSLEGLEDGFDRRADPLCTQSADRAPSVPETLDSAEEPSRKAPSC